MTEPLPPSMIAMTHQSLGPTSLIATNPDMGFEEAALLGAELLMGVVTPSPGGPIQSTYVYEPGSNHLPAEDFLALTCQVVGHTHLPDGINEVFIPEAFDYVVTAYYPIVEDDPEIDGYQRAQQLTLRGFGAFYDALVRDRQLGDRVRWAENPAGRIRGTNEAGQLLFGYEGDVRVRLH